MFLRRIKTSAISPSPYYLCYFYPMSVSIPIEVIELEQDNYHLLASVRFSDGESGKWVIDTGASKSVFDQNLPQYYKTLDGLTEELHSAGFYDEPIKSTLGILESFSFGKFRIDEMKVAVMDLSHINTLYSKYSGIKICGLLGGDFLIRYNAVIDYRKKRMILRK